ncbi:MAG: HIT family protein [Bacteroidales bacterium]|nr:HIT family protein [Bacteroidales bacterium]MCK5338522.1 HIT family protein [Bacteroidales bacterium]
MASIFTKIIRGEIPCYKVAEDEQFFAFLDIRPLAKGHTLVIPKTEVDYIFELEDDLLGDMIKFSKKLGLAIEKVVPCKRMGMTVLGLEVPHAHIHLVPINSVYDIDFKKPPVEMDQDEFIELAAKISAAFE